MYIRYIFFVRLRRVISTATILLLLLLFQTLLERGINKDNKIKFDSLPVGIRQGYEPFRHSSK